MTQKEKKIQETLQKEIWQAVALNILEDPYFIKRRKKKGDEDEDEVKVGFINKLTNCPLLVIPSVRKVGPFLQTLLRRCFLMDFYEIRYLSFKKRVSYTLRWGISTTRRKFGSDKYICFLYVEKKIKSIWERLGE